jgi:hypothetical protein
LRKTGRAYQLTGQIGEYLVAVELGRRGYISTTFTQNIPDFDILAIDETLKRTIPLQVKTIRKGGGWQSVATEWMDIEFKGKSQIVTGKVKLTNPDLIYVLVELGERYGQDRFFLLRKRKLQQLYFRSYVNGLKKHGGKRARNYRSLHCALNANKFLKIRRQLGYSEREVIP